MNYVFVSKWIENVGTDDEPKYVWKHATYNAGKNMIKRTLWQMSQGQGRKPKHVYREYKKRVKQDIERILQSQKEEDGGDAY